MRTQRKLASEVFNNPILVGTVTLLIVVVAVYLSYIAENGLPFIPTYNVSVDVANAAELVKNADVRVGGARVGQVLKIMPEPPTATWPHPFARLQLSLDKDLQPLPYDTRYQVRLASVLGGKYVELIPGSDRNTTATPAVQDGGVFTLKTDPKLSHNIPFVDLDTAFATFGPGTQRGLRKAVHQLGDAVAGRGAQFNDAIGSLRQLIGPLENVLRLSAARQTHLSRLIGGAAATTGALAPVAPTFSSLLADGATTLGALENAAPALGSFIDQLAPTESVATTVLHNAQPVLTGVAHLVTDLRQGAPLLPRATGRLDAILLAATPAFRRAPQLATTLESALRAVQRLAADKASGQTFRLLGSSDLATFGSSAFVGLGAILNAIAPAQLSCNVAGIWIRNIASTFSEGDSAGTWIRFAGVLDSNLSNELLANKPSSDLHANMYPVEDARQCQAGNEPYKPGRLIGNPGTTGRAVANTTPPPGVLARGGSAGLVP